MAKNSDIFADCKNLVISKNGEITSSLPRKITFPKPANSSDTYWHTVFDELDEKIRIPPHKIYKNLKKIMPDDVMLSKLCNILDVEESVDATMRSCQNFMIIDTNSEENVPVLQKRRKRPERPFSDDFAIIDFRESFSLDSVLKNKLPKMMYEKFLKRGKDADRWRDDEKPLKDEDNVFSKQNKLSPKQIVRYFIDWVEESGSTAPFNEDDMQFLFSILIETLANTMESMCCNVQELNSVPESLAQMHNLEQYSHSAMLYKQIIRDLTQSPMKDKKFAFGTALPPDMRKQEIFNNVERWIDCKRIPQDLETMATVWQGIDTLRSTQGYWRFLMDRIDMELPQYMLGPKFKQLNEKTPRFSFEGPNVVNMSVANILEASVSEHTQDMRFNEKFVSINKETPTEKSRQSIRWGSLVYRRQSFCDSKTLTRPSVCIRPSRTTEPMAPCLTMSKEQRMDVISRVQSTHQFRKMEKLGSKSQLSLARKQIIVQNK